MPAICHFYGYTPRQYYDMTTDETNRLVRYMNEYVKVQKSPR